MTKTVPECAVALGLSRRQLERYLRDGAPQLRRGRRGRGGQALLDADAIAAWLAVRSGTADAQARFRAFVADIPEIVADALGRQFVGITGPHKKASGREMQLTWGLITAALIERARRDVLDISEAVDVPNAIIQIAQSCRI